MTDTVQATIQSPWLHPLASTQPPSLSERLTRALEAHVAAEAHDIAGCQALAERMADPVAGLLMGLVVEDDQRHHSLLQSIIHRLQEEVDFVPSPTALPVPSNHDTTSTTDDAAELAASLRGLIRDERAPD